MVAVWSGCGESSGEGRGGGWRSRKYLSISKVAGNLLVVKEINSKDEIVGGGKEMMMSFVCSCRNKNRSRSATLER